MRQIRTRSVSVPKNDKVKIHENPHGRKAVAGTEEEIDKNPKYKTWRRISPLTPSLNCIYGSWDIDVLPSCPQEIRERIAFLPVKHSITYL